MLTFRALGPVRLFREDAELLRGRRKELALLAFIARRAPRPVSRTELATLLWGERPEANARQSLRQAVLHLKRELPEGLSVETETVALTADALDFDVARLESDLSTGRLVEGVARWEGDFLADADDAGGETYRAWLEAEREALRRRYAWALEQLVDDAERKSDRNAAVRWAERWAEALPLDEGAASRLIGALRRAGRMVDALARHAAFVTRLRQELERAPSAEFLRLGEETAAAGRDAPAQRRTPGSTALFTPDLVGRSSALAELTRAWHAARNRTATVVVVEGETGIGKTRVCEEFLRSLAATKERVVQLRTRGYGEAAPDHGAARELLAGLANAPGLSAAPAGALRELARLVPALRERFPHLPDDSATAWTPDEAAAAVLAEVAAEAPVVVFVDDLPAVDRASRDLILGLARRLRDTRVLLMLSGESEPLAPLHATLGTVRIKLQALGLGDVDTLIASMLDIPEADRRELATRVHHETGGVPLFVVETVAALVDEGVVAPDAGGRWRVALGGTDRPLPLPLGVREAVGRRLALLSADARRVADAAAVLAVPADADILSTVAGIAGVECETAIGELLARRLIREAIPPAVGYQFAHEVARRAAYELIPAAPRRSMHRAAVKALRARRPADEATRAALVHHRRRSGSRNALLGPGLAFGAVAVVGGVYMTMRFLGVAPFGTLGTRGVLDKRDRVVLADFVNRTRDSSLGLSVTEALRVDLTQSRAVRMLDRSTIADALRRMARPSGTTLDPATAQELAQREGAKAVVSGEIGQVGNGYVLTARIVAAASGEELAAVRETAGSDELLIPAIDRLSASLRERVGESLEAIRATPPLSQVTTASLPALKKYSEGSQAFVAGETDRALARFDEAVAIDTTFASAYRSIAVILSNRRGEQSRILHAATRAYRYRERLPAIERQLAVAWYYETVEPRVDSAVAAYEAILDIDTSHVVATVNLASILGTQRDYARAEAYVRRAFAHESERVLSAPHYYNLADALVGQGRLAAAESVIGAFAAQQPEAPQPLWFQGLLAAVQHDFATSRAVFDSLSRRYGTSRLWRTRAEEPLAMLDELEGRLGSAERRINALMAMNVQDQSGRDYLLGALALAWLDLRYRDRFAAALRRMHAALDKVPLSSLPREDRPLLELAELFAAAGRPDRARQLRAEWEAATDARTRNDTPRRHAVDGAIAAAEARRGDAVTAYLARATAYQSQGGVWEWCNPCGMFDLAHAYDLAAEPDSAVAAYERALTMVNLPWLYGGAGHHVARAYLRLGELYERRGANDRAAAAYARFIKLWSNADPELQGEVRIAQQRLAAIRQ